MTRALALRIARATVKTPFYIVVAMAAAGLILLAELAIGIAGAFWRSAEFIYDCGKIGVEAAMSKDGH